MAPIPKKTMKIAIGITLKLTLKLTLNSMVMMLSLCINTPAPELAILAMQEEPGLETRMAKAKSDGWNVRGRWVCGEKSRGGRTENKKVGVPILYTILDTRSNLT
jgi:hypothetical protein